MKYLNPKELVVLITGATAGFGLATAKKFIGAGARVIATGRRKERLEALKKELGPHLHILNADVVDSKAMQKGLEGLPAGFRAIDLLVNNAGLGLGLEGADKANMTATTGTTTRTTTTQNTTQSPGMRESQ